VIRRHALTFRMVLVSADALVAIVALWFAATLRFGSGGLAIVADRFPDPMPAGATYIAGWVGVLWLRGLYRPRTRLTVRREILDVAGATITFGVIGLAVLYFSKEWDLSRALIVVLLPTLAVGAIASRFLIRTILMWLRAAGKNTRFMLVAGTGPAAERFANLVEGRLELGLQVIGHLVENGHPVSAVSRPILGGLADFERVMHERIVDEVAICLTPDHWEHVDDLASIASEEGKIVRIPSVFPLHSVAMGPAEAIGEMAVRSIVRGPDRVVGLAGKRLLDVAGSALALAVFALPMGLIALLIRLDSPGPALYRQARVGIHGRPFGMLKFRSMVDGAEAQLDDLRSRNVINGHAFKLPDDPRITRLGRFLRRTSMDELPQFWNVLRGQMSLVGPRPPLPAEVRRYDVWHRRRLSMTPGMTGLWQVRGRREPDFNRWVEYDLNYIDSWSFWLDVKILAQTIPAMIAGR
jgi:exopolysaccharide biosynthesis polyprenyl glycosylphosphotransferase